MSKSRLLLIDDETAILEGIGKYFEALGYEVHRAASGEDGLDVYERVAPDVTILDVMLPGMSGIEVLRVLRQSDARVVMLTGVGEGAIGTEALRLGAKSFLLKPVDMPQLAAAVREAVQDD